MAAALLELRYAVPRGTPPAKRRQMLTDGTALTAAKRGTYPELEPFLSEEALDEVEEKVAESAVEQWSATVASDDPVALSVTSAMPAEPRVAVQHASPSRMTSNEMAAQPTHVSNHLLTVRILTSAS